MVGADVRSSGDLLVAAGSISGNLTVSGSTLSGDGTFTLRAGNDIKIASTVETHLSDTATHRESKSTVKSSSSTSAALAAGSSISGGAVVIGSGLAP